MQKDICRMIVPMALQTPSLLYATTALSAIHLQALSNQSERVKTAPDIARLMARSLEHFRLELQDPGSKGSDALLATARTLCLAEIHSGAIHPNTWRAHIEGAKALMSASDRTSGSPQKANESFRRYLNRWYRSIVSLTALNGNGPPIGDADTKALVITKSDGPDYLDDYWGFTVQLADLFRQIGAVAWRRHQSTSVDGKQIKVDEEDFQEQATSLEISVWRLIDRDAVSTPTFYPDVEDLSADTIREFMLCNEAFQHTALIHIYRRVRKVPATAPEVQQSVKRILECTSQITPATGLSPWVMLTTPMFTAGCEALGEDREEFKKLLTSLHDTVRIPNVLQSLKFLELYWANDQTSEDEDWSHFLGKHICSYFQIPFLLY